MNDMTSSVSKEGARKFLTGGEWVREQEAALSELNKNRVRLRAFVEARCPKEGRILAGVYRFGGGYWLWYCPERITREELQRERLAMAAMEYETLIENGGDPAVVWEKVLPPIGHAGHTDAHPSTPAAQVAAYGDPADVYRSMSIDDICDDPPDGVFSSCGSCRLTYFISHPVMLFAAGSAIVTRARRPVLVHPGRVVLMRPGDPADGSEPTYGFDPPWRPAPWRILDP